MSYVNEAGILLCAVLGVVVVLIGGICVIVGYENGRSDTNAKWRIESAAAGHAEYVTKDGEPVWQWKAIKGETTGE